MIHKGSAPGIGQVFVRTSVLCFTVICLVLGPQSSLGVSSNSPHARRYVPAHGTITIPGGSGNSSDLWNLELGKSLEREISGGENHSYQIQLSVGGFLHAVVDQRGADVIVSIHAPDGTLVKEVDRPNGSRGPEGISLIARSTGTYRVNVRLLDKQAPSGGYKLLVDELRAAVPGDSVRDNAEKSVTKAEKLRVANKPESLLRAIEEFRRAEELWGSLGEPYEQALAHYGLGWTYNEIGSYGMVKFPLPLHRIRWSYESREYLEQAISHFRQSLAIMQKLGDRHGEAIVEAGIAWPYLYLGDYSAAQASFSAALRLYEFFGNPMGQGRCLYGLGWVSTSLGDYESALRYFSQSLSFRQAVNDRRGEAITLASLARVSNREGRNQDALGYCHRALTLFRDVLKDTHGVASTLSVLGWVHRSLGQHKQAIDAFDESLALRREAKDLTGEASALYGMAQVESDQGNVAAALEHMRNVLDIVEPLRDRGSDQELRIHYFANVQEYYDLYIDLAMRLYRRSEDPTYVATAFWASERAHARELLRIIAENLGPVTQPLNQQSVEAQPLQPTEVQMLLDDDTLLLEYHLGRDRSYVWALSRSGLIAGYELPKRSFIEAQVRQLHQLITARIESKTEAMTAQVDAKIDEVREILGRSLIGPVQSHLRGKRLVIVGQGPLQLLPFGVLPSHTRSKPEQKATPLGVNHEIALLPSASTLGVLRRRLERRRTPPKTIAVLADPVFSEDDPRLRAVTKTGRLNVQARSTIDPSGSLRNLKQSREVSNATMSRAKLPRLPGTRWEARQIMSLVPSKEALLATDFDANRATATSPELGQYRIVHFATHALIDDTNPSSSRIVLSLVDESSRRQNGFLTLNDIYQLKLPAELVALSACRTGIGKEVTGEGVIGLTRAFMYAGAHRLVVSLWPTKDKPTAELMARFYRKMLGPERMAPAAALRAAQIELWKDARWEPAYFWGGFILEGDWLQINTARQ